MSIVLVDCAARLSQARGLLDAYSGFVGVDAEWPAFPIKGMSANTHKLSSVSEQGEEVIMPKDNQKYTAKLTGVEGSRGAFLFQVSSSSVVCSS